MEAYLEKLELERELFVFKNPACGRLRVTRFGSHGLKNVSNSYPQLSARARQFAPIQRLLRLSKAEFYHCE